jgi:hypothetical protein
MRRIKEVLRLRFELGLGQREIARACAISQGAVHTRSPSRLATLYTRGFSSLVTSTAALIATGRSELAPGRVYPRCGPAPSRRTRFPRLIGVDDLEYP